jgi:hypothetical protein
VALQPECAQAYFFLARDSGHWLSAADVARIEEALRRQTLPLRDRVNFHFALACLRDRAGDFDAAFRHCDLGNAAKRELFQRQGAAFQPEAHARFVDRLMAVFTPEYFQRTPSHGSPSDLPVFIVGMPRSGTTLVEQILASHPAVHGAGEIRHLQQFVAELPGRLGSAAPYPECLDHLDEETSRRLAEQYLEGLRQLGGDRARVTDKVPVNFHQLGLIVTLFPRAQILHCLRDSHDVCWSCYFQNFRDVPFSCDLRVLGAYYRRYEELMAHWRKVLPVPILDVRYEELVRDLEKGCREILDFCRLPWDGACLSFHRTRRMVRTASNLQVRQPVYTGSVGYWRNYATHLDPLLDALRGS